MSNRRVEHTEDRPTRGETRAERPQRVPLDGDINILNVRGIRPGYRHCWVNEKNVPRYLAAGYNFVDYDVSYGSYHVNQGNSLGARHALDVGQGTTGYLMEILQTEWQADEDARQRRLEEEESGTLDRARAQGLDHGDFHIATGKV